jgi:urea transport system permease protein
MLGDYSYNELGAILAMQGFAGISLFSVLLLMALGLAIIFGQMGVINMAHGEFMAVGAYTTYFASTLTESYFPSFMPYYFIFAIIFAFCVAGFLGYLTEYVLIRHLYKRPLDTLLATWGLSLIMQQSFRSLFGAREVSPTLPEWLLGSYQPTEMIDIPLNGIFVLVLTGAVTLSVFYLLLKSSWGLQVRATTQNRIMSGAVGINTKKVDRYTFALGCGIAGIAGAAFTTIASTGPTTGTLYIVDTFMVVVFGGAASLFGTIASAFSIAQAQSILEFFISSSMAKVYTLFSLVLILMLKPEGLFASKVRR